jgi:acetyl esterase/lipase
MIDRRNLILAALMSGATDIAAAQTAASVRSAGSTPVPLPDPTETIDLWPRGAPGAPVTLPIEVIDERSKDKQVPDRAMRGVVRPRLVVFRPRVPNGSAVLVMPGGGYKWVVIDKEGFEIGRWLSARGFTVFVLFYRLPGDGWKAGPDVSLSDAQRAIRVIRARAKDYAIDIGRVAAMGFSAGGHVCGDLATRFAVQTYDPVDAADRMSARPDIAAPIYAVQSMSTPEAHPGSRALLLGSNPTPALERKHSTASNVTPATPPCFLVHAEDDPTVPVENTLQFRAALKRHGVGVEMHLFANGGHGFGLRRAMGKPAQIWPDLFLAWARTQGF